MSLSSFLLRFLGGGMRVDAQNANIKAPPSQHRLHSSCPPRNPKSDTHESKIHQKNLLPPPHQPAKRPTTSRKPRPQVQSQTLSPIEIQRSRRAPLSSSLLSPATSNGSERRPFVLLDGSVTYYYALPSDHPVGPTGEDEDYWSYLGLDEQGAPPPPAKRKVGGGDEYARLRESVRRYGNPNAGGEDGLCDLRKARDLGKFDWCRESVRRYGNPNVEGEDGVRGLEEFDRYRESVRRYGNPNTDDRIEFSWRELKREEIEDGLNSLGRAQALREYDRCRESVKRYGNPDVEREDNLRASEEYDGYRESARRYFNSTTNDRVGFSLRESRRAEVEGGDIQEAFLKCSKLINESLTERMKYLEDGKSVSLRCIICGRTSKSFSGVHDLIMHAYTSEMSELRVDHLGLHKALCVLMGWNYAKAPETSKAYQLLSADEAAANKEDLIVWPPTVIIHNINTGRRKDGRMDGMSDKEVDMKLKELGFAGGKSKSLYGKKGHLGIAAVKFASSPAGLEEAECLAEYFKKNNRGRKDWTQMETSHNDSDDKKTDEKKNIFYGYLATAADLDKVDIDTRKKAAIRSRREI
ncbi:uncharacterized protein LOC109834620 [Asparagus officinalis]|uniref:uncharacterized protein LOC109834620 n=1 Tax=Asparagus officinalis TaxID=4686 RepID=UPI00098E09BC|nr:uncharacterized protein LOC109834620 [Asparagus officinalis]